MRFGPLPIDEARGAILAHGLRGTFGSFKKGRVLSEPDVEALRAAGEASVVAARLEPGDVPEDDAAARIASAIAGGDGVRVGAPFTGRCNVFAEGPGVLVLDVERIERANAIDESMTIATLPAYSVVQPRQMLATVKIIPFAVEGARLEGLLAVLGGADPALGVAAFRALRIGLVQTALPGTRTTVLDKTSRVVGARVDALGGRVVEERRCAHRADEVAEALRGLVAAGTDLLLVVGASAIVDRRDVVPAGIVAAGGEIEHFGMPVDPGNLLLLARHGARPVLGLPGCARSPKYNGFDQVLERLAAGLAVSASDLARLGVGGLLQEIAERPQPRGGAATAPLRAPRIAALVLAGGQSRRMGTVNKLLVEIDGAPMVVHAADVALEAGCDPVIVVTGHERERVEAALAGRRVRLVHNPEYEEGLSASMRRGIGALGDEVDGVLVCLADMPRVRAEHLARLVAAFDPGEGREICVPTHDGKRGNPVLFASRFLPEMLDIRGDVGARHLIGAHGDSVCEVAMPDRGVLTDVDSPEALADLADVAR